MNEEKQKVYVRSSGEVVVIKDMETTHLLNSLGKQYRELFNAQNKREYEEKMNQVNDLKDEAYKRFNDFREGLED